MKPAFNVRQQSEVYISSAAEILPELLPQGRVVVVSDATIDRLYHPLLAKYDSVLIGTGESIKTLQTVETLYRRFIELGVDRSTFVLGIGGGIVTDVAGFAASTYMRGLPFGFISTTLLGQVDASVGGKNGVNVDGYKNMAGTFTQPQFVVCDPSLLRSLPDREFRAGLAEVVKAAIIADADLFGALNRPRSRRSAPIPTCFRMSSRQPSASRPISWSTTRRSPASAASSTSGIRWPTPSRSPRTA